MSMLGTVVAVSDCATSPAGDAASPTACELAISSRPVVSTPGCSSFDALACGLPVWGGLRCTPGGRCPDAVAGSPIFNTSRYSVCRTPPWVQLGISFCVAGVPTKLVRGLARARDRQIEGAVAHLSAAATACAAA